MVFLPGGLGLSSRRRGGRRDRQIARWSRNPLSVLRLCVTLSPLCAAPLVYALPIHILGRRPCSSYLVPVLHMMALAFTFYSTASFLRLTLSSFIHTHTLQRYKLAYFTCLRSSNYEHPCEPSILGGIRVLHFRPERTCYP